jgi:hypothetical protein
MYANAQEVSSTFDPNEEFQPYWNFGIKQGVNYSMAFFNPSIDQSPTFGYTGGLVYKYQNQRMVGLQLELNYTQKGWTENLAETGNSYNRKMAYVELPLITHIVFGQKTLKYHINIGTTFAYLISEKEDYTVVDELYRKEYYGKEIEKKFDYSGLGEAGVVYNSKIGEFQAGVRFQWTLTDLFETSSETTFDKTQNALLSFAITYFIFSNK